MTPKRTTPSVDPAGHDRLGRKVAARRSMTADERKAADAASIERTMANPQIREHRAG